MNIEEKNDIFSIISHIDILYMSIVVYVILYSMLLNIPGSYSNIPIYNKLFVS